MPDVMIEKFDPEGTGYDDESRTLYGLEPDETGHDPSRVPETGLILKGRTHETFNRTIAGERSTGNVVYKNADGRYYSNRPDLVPEGAEVISEMRIQPVSSGKQKYIDELRSRHGDSPALRELERRYAQPTPLIDPVDWPKNITANVLAIQLGLEPDTVMNTYDEVVQQRYGETLTPEQVQERMQSEGELYIAGDDFMELSPQDQFLYDDIQQAAKAVVKGEEINPEAFHRIQRRQQVKELGRAYEYFRSIEDRAKSLIQPGARWITTPLPGVPVLPIPTGKLPTGESSGVYEARQAAAEITGRENLILDPDVLFGLIRSSVSQQEAEEIIKDFRRQYQLYLRNATQQQIDELERRTATEDQGVFWEFQKAFLKSAANVPKGFTGIGADYLHIPGAQDLRESLDAYMKQTALLPSQAEGAGNFLARSLGSSLPFFITAWMGAGTGSILTNGAKLGRLIGGMLAAYAVEGESAYQDAKDTGASEFQAQSERAMVGTVNAAIEYMQLDKWLTFAKGGKRSLPSLRKMIQDRAYKEIAKSGGRLTGKAVALSINEGIEEALQEGVSLSVPAMTRGEYPKTEDGKPDWTRIIDQIHEAYWGGAAGGLFLGGAGYGVGALRTQDAKTKLALSFQIHDLMDEDTSYEIAHNVIHRMTEGEDFRTAYLEEAGPHKLVEAGQKTIAHVLAKQKGLDETKYRNLAEQVTGKRSLLDMNFAEAEKFIDRLRSLPDEVPEAEKPTEAEEPVITEPTEDELERQRYDELLERVQAGEEAAIDELNAMVQRLSLPTYEELLARSMAGDISATLSIQEGRYRTPPTLTTPEGVPLVGEIRPKTPPAQIKMFLTQADKQALRDLGYDDDQIYQMKPEEGQRIINEKISPAAPPEPAVVKERLDSLFTNEQGQTEIVTVATEDIQADPKRFQYKMDSATEEGISKRLSTVTTWNPKAAGVILVWQDKAGSYFVVDGHHRLALAKRLDVDTLNAFILRESEGITAQEARIMGAMSNLANDKGTPADAAKLFRDADIDIDFLKREGIDTTSALVRHGLAMKNLSDEVFRMVIDEKVPANLAAIVGLNVKNPAHQIEIARQIESGQVENAKEVEYLARTIDAIPVLTREEATLFGKEFYEKSLFAERAKILANIERIIRQNKRIFGVLIEKSGIIETRGNILNLPANEQARQQAAEILYILDKLAHSKGPIAEALNDATKEYAEDPTRQKLGEVSQRLIERWTTTDEIQKIFQGVSYTPAEVEERKRPVGPSVEGPVQRAVQATAGEGTVSSGFHTDFSKDFNGIDPSWAIVYKGTPSEAIRTAAEQSGLTVNERTATSGQVFTDIYLPDVPQTDTKTATEVFDRFAENYQAGRRKPLDTKTRKKIDKLRQTADRQQSKIDDKRREMTQNPTPKRMKEYKGRLWEADNLERAQKAMYATADAIEEGTLPAILEDVTTLKDIQPLVYKGLDQRRAGYYDVIPSDEYYDKSEKGKALQSLLEGAEAPEEATARRQREATQAIKDKEEAFRFLKIPGFFPTPRPVIERMYDLADIQEGETVLEPSAGKGDIVDFLREQGHESDVVEIRPSLQEILKLKGYNLVGEDFLIFTGRYDKIIMNPPFEKGQDIDHVRHAYDLLNPGGRLVSVMSAGSFFRSDKKAMSFRDWFQDLGGEEIETEPGAFKGVKAFRQTGASSRIAVIDKTEGEERKDVDLLGRPLLRGGAAGEQREFLDREKYLTMDERERINAQQDIEDQRKLFPERGGFLDLTPFGNKRVLDRKINELVDYIEARDKPKKKPTKKARKPDDRQPEPSQYIPGKTMGELFYEVNKKRTTIPVKEKLGSIKSEAMEKVDLVLGSMSTRLRNIAASIFHQVRRHIYISKHRARQMVERITPFVEGVTKKFSDADQWRFELAGLNGAEQDILNLAKKYGLENEYREYRTVMDEIYEMGYAVGMDIHYRMAYFPRQIKDLKGLLKYLRTTEQWSVVSKALQIQAEKAGRNLTEEEQAQIVNTLLRGFQTAGLTIATPGFAKNRTVPIIDSEIAKYYHDWKSSVSKYIHAMSNNIEARRFFGKESREASKQRARIKRARNAVAKLENESRVRTLWGEEDETNLRKAKEKLARETEKFERMNINFVADSIGSYVLDAVKEGLIDQGQQEQLQGILVGVFNPKSAHGWIQKAMKLSYIDTLSQVTNAITQAGELVLPMLKDPLRTLPSYVRAIARKSKITLYDIGVEKIGQEWADVQLDRVSSKLLWMMEQVDRLGKETFINTVIDKYRAVASKNPAKLREKLQRTYGAETDEVMADLLSGQITENIKYLAFAELSEVQPISILEMPEAYARGGNLRVFYMLRSFTIKRLDYLRNECLRDIASGDPEKILRGAARLIWMVFWMIMADTSADAMKDFVRGRPFDLRDTVIDNFWQMLLLSKYSTDRLAGYGIGGTTGEILSIPTPFGDAMLRDLVTLADEDSERGSELVRRIPWIGELYYWWIGEGSRKIEEGYYERD